MFENFTPAARDAVVRAQREAHELDCDYIGTEHLLLALLAEEGDPACKALRGLGVGYTSARRTTARELGPCPPREPDSDALRAIGIDLDAVRRKAEEAFGPGALDPKPRTGLVPFTSRTKKVFDLALREAVRESGRGGEKIEGRHLVLGMVREGRCVGLRVLDALGVDRATLTRRLAQSPGSPDHG